MRRGGSNQIRTAQPRQTRLGRGSPSSPLSLDEDDGERKRIKGVGVGLEAGERSILETTEHEEGTTGTTGTAATEARARNCISRFRNPSEPTLARRHIVIEAMNWPYLPISVA
jgi:hypothetical protein